MFCKKCGAALPSHGYICKSCGMMMSTEQIKEQKAYMKENKEDMQVNFLSDRYSDEAVKRDYSKIPRENKYLGAILIVLVVIVLIIIAILKVM